jgi:U3 small nucleolar RNA-associated protein 12
VPNKLVCDMCDMCDMCDQVVDVKGESYDVSSRLDLPGHRSDVRCLALSADDTQVTKG